MIQLRIVTSTDRPTVSFTNFFPPNNYVFLLNWISVLKYRISDRHFKDCIITALHVRENNSIHT